MPYHLVLNEIANDLSDTARYHIGGEAEKDGALDVLALLWVA